MRPTLEVNYQQLARLTTALPRVRVGHYFAFVAGDAAPAPTVREGRFARLLAKQGPRRTATTQVVPLLDAPVDCLGVKLIPPARNIEPIGCVVADRDLYRAEQDTVNMLVAFPLPPSVPLRLLVEHNGQPLTERALELDPSGLALETLAMLLPGSYSAQLELGGRRIGVAANFTVAEYSLAPLSARLVEHRLDRAAGRLSFELAVESYQVPFAGKLAVALVEAGREVKHTKVKADRPGHYRGQLKLKGEGPFRLRLSAITDAGRVAEVALPGSRAAEREVTVISELGRERLFSLLAEPHALPVRGGWLTQGDVLATPLIVDEIVATERLVRVQRATKQLTAVSLDLGSGTFHVDRFGDVAVDTRVVVPRHGPMTAVFLGGVIDDEPFEGYTTFITPSVERLRVELPQRARPREDLVVRLRLGAAGSADRAHPYRSASDPARPSQPVLLTVRDQRLTTTDPPDVALAAAAKRGIDAAVVGMAQEGICPLQELMPDYGYGTLSGGLYPPAVYSMSAAMPRSAAAPGAPPLVYATADLDMPAAAPARAAYGGSSVKTRSRIDDATERYESTRDSFALELAADAPPPAGESAPADEPGPDEPAPAPQRGELPEQLFFGLVALQDGCADVIIPLPDSLATFTVEAFSLRGGDWQRVSESVVVDQPLRVDLELPPAIHGEDQVQGRLRAASGSGRLRVALRRDDEPVQLLRDGKPLEPRQELSSPVDLTFRARAGRYVGSVEDVASGESDQLEIVVGEPGKHRFLARELGLLQAGDAITLESADALTLRVLPGLDERFGMLTRATAGYGHLCCEQTAAKILAAVFMYLASDQHVERKQAESIILAGIARERSMLVPGKGFRMYPESDFFSEHYSSLAVRYLWTLRKLAELPGLGAPLTRAAREGVELADVAAKAHRMTPVPKAIAAMEDAYAVAAAGGDAAAVRAFVSGQIEITGKQVRVRSARHAVADRSVLAYAAAACVAIGDLPLGLRLANVVTRQLDEQGALYSTVDSAAAISMLLQLRHAGVAVGQARLRVNGAEMSAEGAQALGDQVESLEVLEGVAAVEVTQLREDDWTRSAGAFKLEVGFRGDDEQRLTRFAPSDRVDLVLTLPDGYAIGDLAHVQLPAALSRIEGGGKVKRFSVDFAGGSELRVPLVVTAPIAGQQHFAVCVRNMFEEERAASPGLLTVEGV